MDPLVTLGRREIKDQGFDKLGAEQIGLQVTSRENVDGSISGRAKFRVIGGRKATDLF